MKYLTILHLIHPARKAIYMQKHRLTGEAFAQATREVLDTDILIAADSDEQKSVSWNPTKRRFTVKIGYEKRSFYREQDWQALECYNQCEFIHPGDEGDTEPRRVLDLPESVYQQHLKTERRLARAVTALETISANLTDDYRFCADEALKEIMQ